MTWTAGATAVVGITLAGAPFVPITQTEGGTDAVPTAVTWFSLQPTNPARAPFRRVISGTVFNGDTDYVQYDGYNAAASGGRVSNTEPKASWQIESNYNDGSGDNKVEVYFEWISINGAKQRRPLFWQFDRTTGDISDFELKGITINFVDWATAILMGGFSLGTLNVFSSAGPTDASVVIGSGPSGPTTGAHSHLSMYDGALPGSRSFGIDTASANQTTVIQNGVSTLYFFTSRGIAVNVLDNTAAFTVQGNALGPVAQIRAGAVAGDLLRIQDSSSVTQVKINSTFVFFPVQAPTASAPAYVLGGMYYDTTLNKLRIGGATAWETVTSA